jgi:hypothetical protein
MPSSSPALSTFLVETLAKPDAHWQWSEITRLSQRHVPDQLFGGRQELLRYDIHRIWASWFLESLCDPERYAKATQPVGYAVLYEPVFCVMKEVLRDVPLDELRIAARAVAKLLESEVERRRLRSRSATDREERLELLDAVSPEVRCWICGYKFTEAAISRFRDGNKSVPEDPLPQFVDYLKPSGLVARDRHIEADHIVSVAAGGTSTHNLALACGWCNSHKSAFSSVYDQALSPLLVAHPKAGLVSVPRPFWVVRLLASRRRCEFVGGCNRSSSNAELTIMLRNPQGAANPTNLIVVCRNEHDRVGRLRFVHRKSLQVAVD